MSRDDSTGRFRPGASGNPRGRPPGSGRLQAVRQQIEAALPEIIEVLIGQVTRRSTPDAAAAKLLIERVLPRVGEVDPARIEHLEARMAALEAQRAQGGNDDERA